LRTLFIETLCLDVKTVVSTTRFARDSLRFMPKLWHDTIEAHRNAVAQAIMDRTAALAAAEGLHGLTMARIAQETGIGRATLYKYFKDVEEILASWHRRQVAAHLEDLEAVRSRHPDPVRALEAVLLAYAAHSAHDHHGSLGRLLHALPHVDEAHRHLQSFVTDLVREALEAGKLKAQGSSDELARYALAAMDAATGHSRAALTRLVGMVLKGMGVDTSDS
jgi:AcrR family transcriptional regulator